MVNYDAQVGQMPTPYYTGSSSGSRKRKIGLTLAGGLIGMNAYYLPVQKDSFVNKAFSITKKEADEKISVLKNIAEEVAQDKVSTESKMILQDMGVAEDVVAITNKCSELDKSTSDPARVKALKEDFNRNFKTYKKDVASMDNVCAKAFKAVKQNKFKWGAGIGGAIGLALGLMTSRD
jgi:ElaB/YqjD/DUF883 family membrane-anchored ribosome-binding protein